MTESTALRLRRGYFFGIGNPLLDLSKEVDANFLEKFNLNDNQAILAGPEHETLFRSLQKNARGSVGGSSQNIMRTVAWFLQQKEPIAIYMGSVGNDFAKEQLIELAEPAGLDVLYQTHKTLPTGRCAVLINEQDGRRTMVTSLGASGAFTVDFLRDQKNWAKVEEAEIFCSEGFFLLSCREAFMHICEHAFKHRKLFSMTLSAKFICDDPYGVGLLSALPYADVVFGYEDEAKILVKKQFGLDSSVLKTIIEALRDCPKWNKDRPRTVVVSKVPEKTVVATENEYKVYIWKKPSKIIDTHGCGAALAGGFLAQLALGKPIDQCVNAGLYCAYEILQRIGAQFPTKQTFNDKMMYYKTDPDD